jgi:two-component system LytT family response regulator
MKKIRSVIIEDESEDMNLMINLLKNFDMIEVVATAGDIEHGVAAITVHKPDLIFLDINLYGRNSFEILDIIRNFNMSPKVIFTTAYNNYMNLAFKYSAFDYLLKPIDRKELKNTLERFINDFEQTDFNKSYEKFNSVKKKLIFNTVEGFEVIAPQDIVYLCTVKNQSYTEIYLTNGSVTVVTKSIGEIEPLLNEDYFFKIHRSYILNLNYVKKVNRILGKCYLQHNNIKYEIPVSREKARLLKEKLLKQN